MVKIKSLPWWAQCMTLWLCVFVLLNVAGHVGARFLDEENAGHACLYDQALPDRTPGIWRRWDACFYVEIAGHGYAEESVSAGFFPLYPMLMAFIRQITGAPLEVAGFVVSNVACLLSILVFYQLGRLVKDDHAFAMRSVLALLVFPSAFFYFALYAESVYLLFALIGAYLALKKSPSFLGAGLALGISSIARPVGWLLDIVLFSEFVKMRKFDLKTILSLGLGMFLSVIGVILYVYYLFLLLGTFSAIPEAQSHWPRQWQLPWMTYWEGLRTLANPALVNENWFAYAMNAIDLFFSSAVIVIILISFMWAKRGEFPWSLSIYSLVMALFFLSSQNELPSPLWGMTRWVGSLFPIFFIIGNLFKNQKIQTLLFACSAIVLIFFTIWWTSGRWIG